MCSEGEECQVSASSTDGKVLANDEYFFTPVLSDETAHVGTVIDGTAQNCSSWPQDMFSDGFFINEKGEFCKTPKHFGFCLGCSKTVHLHLHNCRDCYLSRRFSQKIAVKRRRKGSSESNRSRGN